MLKKVLPEIWAFDAEWVPDPFAGRVLYNLPSDYSDREVIAEMWKRAGADEKNPRPFLKVALCKLVSVAAVVRRVADDGVMWIELLSLPRPDAIGADGSDEKVILHRFLSGIGKHKPQLVGYNSVNSDLKIFVQRALIHGLSFPDFCSRPDKPWEGVDYFVKENNFHIDMYQLLGGWGGPSLHELAVLSGIPGKLDATGDDVALMWLDKRYNEIVNYNECDALTTYLVWLRMAYLCGHLDDAEYREEQERVEELLATSSGEHLDRFRREWQRLRGLHTVE